MLVARRGIRAAGTDLLAPPYYLWEPLERFYPEVMSFDDLSRRATLRSPWPETSFCLICDGKRDVALEVKAAVEAGRASFPSRSRTYSRPRRRGSGNRGMHWPPP